MQSKKFNVLLDLQWGSCGKGKFAATLARMYRTKNLSSSHRPNAGHTVVSGSKKFVGKVFPSAAVLASWEQQSIACWLSAGSAFELERFQTEWHILREPPLYVHAHAQVVTEKDKEQETELVSYIASTLQGSGTAQARKVMRSAPLYQSFKPEHSITAQNWTTTVDAQIRADLRGWLHESSQGWALSLDHGHLYPHVTSRNCGVAAALDQMGVQPRLLGDVYGLFRPFPIRVGDLDGNTSGPTYSDSREISWQEIAEQAGHSPERLQKILDREHTTVTKRLRRVFTLSWIGLDQAIQANGVNRLIMNFAQYLDAADEFVREPKLLSYRTRMFIQNIEENFGVPVVMVGTGEDLDDVVTL